MFSRKISLLLIIVLFSISLSFLSNSFKVNKKEIHKSNNLKKDNIVFNSFKIDNFSSAFSISETKIKRNKVENVVFKIIKEFKVNNEIFNPTAKCFLYGVASLNEYSFFQHKINNNVYISFDKIQCETKEGYIDESIKMFIVDLNGEYGIKSKVLFKNNKEVGLLLSKDREGIIFHQ